MDLLNATQQQQGARISPLWFYVMTISFHDDFLLLIGLDSRVLSRLNLQHVKINKPLCLLNLKGAVIAEL